MSSIPRRQPMLQRNDMDTPENIEDLACVITSEARGLNETAQKMVGWTVVNRMKKDHLTRVSEVWEGYAHGHLQIATSKGLAKDILNGRALDISQGATHFYTPSPRPKEGEPHSGFDVREGLERVPGVTKNGKSVQNYRPYWAKRLQPVFISGVMEKDFKFYKHP